jgi:bacterioferritin-associated ferredoxin
MSRIIRNAIDNHSHLRLNQCSNAKRLFFMYVCICNAITDKQIRRAAASGVKDLCGLQAELGVAAGCGSCGEVASEILAEYRDALGGQPAGDPKVYVPAMA